VKWTINEQRREGIPYYIIYRGAIKNGKRKTASKREQRKCIYSAEREQIQDDAVGLNLRVSESMVGTRHAVSDNNSKSGLGMPSPYIPRPPLRTLVVTKFCQR